MFYADDVCLISLSTAGMQKLVHVCQDYALSHDLLFNSNKSMCMKFVTKSHMKTFPPMTLMGSEISFVDQCKYLGTIIDVQTSDSDMKLQMKRLCSCDMAPCGKFRADGGTR